MRKFAFLMAGAHILIATPTRAQGLPLETVSRTCVEAIHAAESTNAIPTALLQSIAIVESGRKTETGSMAPWPWSINANGVGYTYGTKAQAVEAARQFRTAGTESIDVGCMQVNLMHHPTAFRDLEHAFDPVTNASFAGNFLAHLHDVTGTWQGAAGGYHSMNPERSTGYRRKVMAVWGNPTPDMAAPSQPEMLVPELAAQVAAQRIALADLAPRNLPHTIHVAASARRRNLLALNDVEVAMADGPTRPAATNHTRTRRRVR